MKPNFKKLDLNELAILFLKFSDPITKRLLANKIWEKSHEMIERIIVAYLGAKGVDIIRMPEAKKPEKLINEIYFEIYEKIFSVVSLTRRLKNYDDSKNIRPWLSSVVRTMLAVRLN